jgi:hypothetical protein
MKISNKLKFPIRERRDQLNHGRVREIVHLGALKAAEVAAVTKSKFERQWAYLREM